MAAVIAKGNAEILINARETAATLVFTPDSEGLGWDTDAVIKLCGEKRLSPAPNPKSLEPFLAKAGRAKTKDPMEMVLLEGTPPEDPVGETIVWETMAVPGDLAPFKDETLAEAGAPELYRVRTEKIKKERMVKKAGALPFLPAKEEMVVTWEKKEIREKAEVNPEVKDVRYTLKGKKAGTLSPPRPGKPGKSVFGRPLAPAVLGGGEFLLGNGFHREKNGIFTDLAGFVRIGENWADIVPLAKSAWGVDKGSDGITYFLRFESGDPRFPPPAGADIIAAAKAKGAAGASLVDASVIDEAVAAAVKNNEALEAFPVSLSQEAAAQVDISPDKLEAVLNLRKGIAGGRPLEMRIISQALKDSGVRGFDAEKLRADLKTFMDGPDTELSNYVLVQGKAAARGKDRELTLSVALLEEPGPVLERIHSLSPARFSSDGAVIFPMADVTGLALVQKGLKVAEISKSSPGEDGRDVYGAVIPGLPGNDPELQLFRGLEQHGAAITAARDGLLLLRSSPGSFAGQVIDYRDAEVTIHVSGNAMEASADIIRETGAGQPLEKETVLKALAGAGVVKGIDTAAVEAACSLAKAKGGCQGQILASGEPALAKGAPRVKWLLPELRSIELRSIEPRSAEAQAAGPRAGEAPAGKRTKSITVKAGVPLAEIRSGLSEGRPGFDVKGTVLAVENGLHPVVNHDDSVKEIPQGAGVCLSAARSGELTYNGRDLSISTIQDITGDVGPATGNISFSGEVRVGGKIQPGFTVVGGLHVYVDGSAEQALVSAGGKAVIAGGIHGGGKGVVRARNTIETAFAEEATLLAVEDIKVQNGCAGCNIKTNGRLFIASENGKLIGGVCRARHGVNAQDVGSERKKVTEISFGQDYLIKDQIETTERELEKVKAGLRLVDQKIKQAAKTPASLTSARSEKVKLLKLLEQLNLKVFTLRERYEEHHDSEVRVRGFVYPGVVMESHDRYYEVHQTRRAVVFYFDRETGRILDKSLE
jgi:uncharacterized protein (DUF342 family)